MHLCNSQIHGAIKLKSFSADRGTSHGYRNQALLTTATNVQTIFIIYQVMRSHISLLQQVLFPGGAISSSGRQV